MSANPAQKSIIRLFAIIVLGNLILAAFVFIGGFTSSPPPKPLPNPNGFDFFVKAADALPPANYRSYKSLSPDELAPLASNAQPTLTILRQGLTNQSRVPLEFSTNYIQQVMTTITSFKELNSALAAEGRLAELNGETNRAAETYLDIMNFGQKSSQDSVIIMKLVGVAIEAHGRQLLEPLVPSLDSQTSRNLVKGLESINAEEPPIEENLRQEARWISKTYSWTSRLAGLIAYKQTRKVQDSFKQKVEANQLARRQLILALAAHAYQLDHGKPPASTADLTPNYLTAIPLDPATGTNLVLQPSH